MPHDQPSHAPAVGANPPTIAPFCRANPLAAGRIWRLPEPSPSCSLAKHFTGRSNVLYLYSTLESPTMLAIRLPPDIEARLEALAQATGRTKSFYARAAIVEHLADMEDVYLAEARLEDIRAGRAATLSLDAVKQSLDLED
jgi:RHH-type rel operon transcriptional repressor/antitoxin RelB